MTASGGIIQISARGSQDEVVNGNPQYTVFKATHSRFTSFASDDDFIELSNSGFDTTSTATLNRYGDLISRVTLEIVLPPLAAPVLKDGTGATRAAADCSAYYVNSVGFACWEYLQFEIGGGLIDEVFSDFAFIYEELAGRPGLRLEEQIGRVPYSSDADGELVEKARKQQTLFVPIPLWFSIFTPQTWGNALPIVALAFHDCRIKIKTRTIQECTCVVYKDAAGAFQLEEGANPINASTGSALVNADLKMRVMVTSVYLDVPERTAMSAVAHSFLISVPNRQVHSIPANQSTRLELKLFASHPSSSLIWYMRPLDWATAAGRRRYSVGFRDRYDFTSQVPGTVDADTLPYGDCTDPVTTASLSLNAHSRWPESMNSVYFRTHQPSVAWRTMPSTSIYTYSFALEASSWQPTSTLNFSRIDHVSLGQTFAPGVKASELITTNIHYNVLSIVNGLGGLRFSN